MLEQDNNKIIYNIDELIKNNPHCKEIIFNIDELIKDNPHYKGYIYDSLMFRYMRAREAMARLEIKEGRVSPTTAMNMMERDTRRFSEILNEAIVEHD